MICYSLQRGYKNIILITEGFGKKLGKASGIGGKLSSTISSAFNRLS